jgi:Domain of unknown function (DUF6249)
MYETNEKNPEIMKKIFKILTIILLVGAGTCASLRAQTNEGDEADTNNTASAPAAPTTPAAPAAPQAPARHPEASENIVDHTPRVEYVPRNNVIHDLENLLVPIVSVVVVFGAIVGVCGTFFVYLQRRNQTLHETVRLMVEKGVAIPPELLAPPERKAPQRVRNDHRKGWILIGVGVGLICLAMFGDHGPAKMGVVGFIPLFLGIAFLMVARFERKNKDLADS